MTDQKKPMEEIVVKAKRPPKEVIRKNRQVDAANMAIRAGTIALNPAGFVRGQIKRLIEEAYRNRKQEEGPFERDRDENPEDYDPNRFGMQEGGELAAQMGALMPAEEEVIPAEEDTMPIEMAEEPVETKVPDEEMEEDYLDFVINEALSPEDEQYLFDRLSEDDQLSEIFDKVVETASEFSGSGPVEGPGTAVSDSIPARLSDGEFVITSKATDQIGPDVLQELMQLAEEEADVGERQTAETGGLAKAQGSAIIAGVAEDERGLAVKNKEAMRLLDPRLSLFAS